MRITMLERATGRTGVATSLARAGHPLTMRLRGQSHANPLCARARRSKTAQGIALRPFREIQ